MKKLSWGLSAVVLAAFALMTPTAAQAAEGTVTIGGQFHSVTGTNIYRSTDSLVKYTPAKGARTGTNAFGFEAAVVNGKVTTVSDRVGNMTIPANGYVLSGHGEARQWLLARATVGASVALSTDPPPSATNQLPDVGVRTLRQFIITNNGTTKMLKFPAVTANVGAGALEITGKRSSATSDDWVSNQVVYKSDGSKTTLPSTGATFYYAGDGHSHWHIRDFDSYDLFNSAGTKLRQGEKHGFCFEDNTTYRDWVGSPKHPNVPLTPVYAHETSCGEGHPGTTSIVHGLSVGWGDTYPTSLPDQGIDITDIPDGTYLVKVTADWQDFWRETNETNNSASAQVRISGNTVTLVSATDGL